MSSQESSLASGLVTYLSKRLIKKGQSTMVKPGHAESHSSFKKTKQFKLGVERRASITTCKSDVVAALPKRKSNCIDKLIGLTCHQWSGLRDVRQSLLLQFDVIYKG